MKTESSKPEITSSNKLRIEVKKQSGTEITLNFEVKLLADLKDLMGEELHKQVIDHGVQLELILAKAHTSDFEPQILFEINDSHSKVKVSIVK